VDSACCTHSRPTFYRATMQVLNNKVLLLNLRNPKKVTNLIPKSRELPDNKVAVKWGLDEVHTLKKLNIRNIPSPILGHYNWPGQHKPFDHQKTTAAFLTLHQKALCLNEQGTGKTGSVIWAADYLMTVGKIKRVLVICPLSIMDSAWRADLFKFAMHRTVDIAYGKSNKRKEIINGPAEFVIINYDGVEIVADDILKANFDLIVVDEANAYKNTQTQRWKTLYRLVSPRTWLWMLTGTPAAQSPTDAFGLAKLVNPMGVPKFFTAFKDMVMYKVSQYRWIPKESAVQTVFNALQPAIRFTKDECLDLPEMTYVTRDVPLTPQQKKYYDLLKKRLVIQAAGEEITAFNAAVELNKLLQISCGAVYSDSGETIEFTIDNRYRVLKEVIDEASHKVLIFVPFKHVIDIICEKLKTDGITTEIISGDVSAQKRTDIFKRFQETSNPRVLVIQPQAAAHGVTLTAADTIVWWGPTPSLEIFAQANARVHRPGQRHPTTVVQLQGSNSEKYVYKLLNQKIDVHQKIVELYKDLLD
jgi:SNF2 family DNA or RNA helicase